MFYISASIAIIGAVCYQYFVKRVPSTINPVVSVMGIYVAVFALGAMSLPLFPAEGGLIKHIRQLNWIQLAIAASVFLIELGFLLMYRRGIDLSGHPAAENEWRVRKMGLACESSFIRDVPFA